ncbi:MAG TPA: glycosyltransferase [Stellaceae bacterium]|nr:glycosyltransferase [Stellaceae bacterium]
MRVLHIITGLRRGGAEAMLAKLIAAHADSGIENHVVCLVERGPLAIEIERIGAPVIVLGMRSKAALGAVLRLPGIVRRLRPDIVETWLYHADLAGLIAAALTRRLPRLIWNLRCSDMDAQDRARSGLKLMLRILARCSALPNGIIVNSHAGRLYHEALGYRPKWWAEIPNGFDLERWRRDETAGARLRSLCGVPETVPVVGMCARVAPMKDHSNFLRAIAALRAGGTSVHAALVGRGTEALAGEVALLKLEAQVSLLGERSDLPDLMPGFDLLCLSSAFGEGFANVLGEAMACCVPCVATDVGDAAAIVGDTGRIVPPREPEALAAALRDLLAMPAAARAALGLRARRRIEEHYGIARIAQQYLEVYEAVLAGTVPAGFRISAPSSPAPLPGLKHQDVP